MDDIKRIPAGVMFESDVLAYIDQIAAEQRRSRSFIINHLIRLFARQQEQKAPTSKAFPMVTNETIKF
jgi:hypothetical protein